MAATVWSNNSITPSYNTIVTGADNIVRLVEDPSIVKNISLDELSMQYVGAEYNNGDPVDHTEAVGVQYPIIRINDITFGITEIVRMSISSEGFIPTIDLTISYPSSEFVSKNMPKDGDIISTYIRSNTAALNFLRNDFIITSCETSNSPTSKRTKISLSGKLYINGIDAEYNIFSVIGNSKTVCKEVAKKFGIGFSYNDEDETKDFQNWICSGSVENFITDVISHSWKDSESFFNAWIDLYYDLCFVNVNKFLLSKGDEKIDITYASLTSMYQNATDVNSENIENAEITVKLFSNMSMFKGTPFYILKWNISNNSGVSINEGYEKISYTFIHNQILYKRDKYSCFSTMSNYPSYDVNKTDSHMILRGRTSYDPAYALEGDMARVNYDSQNTYIQREWGGIEYTVEDAAENDNANNSNNWTGNVHKNYSRAPMHNSINKTELEKMYITIICDGLCLQVMRGEKIPVILEKGVMQNLPALNDENIMSTDNFNRMYSGFYIVDSIEYRYNGTGNSYGARSAFTTHMTLKRREWPTPEPIKTPNE